MAERPWRSWFALRTVQVTALLLLVALAGFRSTRSDESTGLDSWAREIGRQWCAEHPDRGDLQVVAIDVRFHAEPPLFAPGEGVVVAPVALDLERAQRVLAVASRPAAARTLSVHGITSLAWPYPGRTHRELSFGAAALVERPRRRAVTAMEAGETFSTLSADVGPDALARVVDTEEHALNRCADFARWAAATAGPPPHTAQIERLVQAVAARAEQGRQPDDVCAAVRAGRFTPHWAQVAVVMAAREVGIPTFGFAAAADTERHLVGTYTDGAGWILIDVERPGEGWSQGGPPLITRAPNLGGFPATAHGFWSPEAGAYARATWSIQTLSSTEWRGGLAAGTRTDTTEARAFSLEEVCR